MRTTSKRMNFGCGVFFLLVLGGCRSHPVEPSGGAPSFTGYTYGSGHNTQDTTAATASAAGDTTARGGYTYGSGN
jgi:hypothetical protein